MSARRSSGIVFFVTAVVLISCSIQARAEDSEIQELKRQIKILTDRVDQLEHEKQAPMPSAPAQAPPPATATPPPSRVELTGVPETPAAIRDETAPVTPRGSMNDQQEAAPRPGDLTLDPKYRGFSQIPNTPVLIKFNAKPRTDATSDNRNSGDDNRFVTARIPVEGAADHGGSEVFNINAKASQLRIDVRAPEVAGSPRFYYENDFFGSGGGEFPYRVRHLYGQIYDVIVGQTFSVFEDPDVWPDTVDYEGPNAAVFARRPLIRYQQEFNDEWQLNLGLEQPESEIDTTGQPAGANGKNRAPDGGFNVRWENLDIGHVQLASIFRDLGVQGTTRGEQHAFGWGLNLSGGFNVFGRDSLQVQGTYGDGMFRYSNDDFQNDDAAFDSDGDLEPLTYAAAMFGYTHHWTDTWRSTASFGYVNLDNAFSQAGSAYHETYYGSFNVMWQLRKRLSVGLEELYGSQETKNGADGDVWRTQLGLVYSIFD